MAASKRFLLRLDPHLFDALRRWAEDDLRSINAQIEYLLTDQARRTGRLPHKRSNPDLPDPPAEDEPASASRQHAPATVGAGPSTTLRPSGTR
jgi:hypothetical protein